MAKKNVRFSSVVKLYTKRERKKKQNKIKRMLLRAHTRIYVYREVADYIQKLRT